MLQFKAVQLASGQPSKWLSAGIEPSRTMASIMVPQSNAPSPGAARHEFVSFREILLEPRSMWNALGAADPAPGSGSGLNQKLVGKISAFSRWQSAARPHEAQIRV